MADANEHVGEGADYRSRLLSMGLLISSNRKARELLPHYIQSSLPDQRVRCTPRVGWNEETYVLPDGQFGLVNELPQPSFFPQKSIVTLASSQ